MSQRFAFTSLTRACAARILAKSFGRALEPGHRFGRLDQLPLVRALIDLEKAFAIDLDVDEAYRLDAAGLIGLVERRAGQRRDLGGCTLYDLATFRAAVAAQ